MNEKSNICPKTPQNINIWDNRNASLMENKSANIVKQNSSAYVFHLCVIMRRSWLIVVVISATAVARTEILESFSLRTVSLFFPLFLHICSQQHDVKTRGAETNLRLFYPMFVFPQAGPPHMPGTSQTPRACHATPRRRRSRFLMEVVTSAFLRDYKNSSHSSEVSKRSTPQTLCHCTKVTIMCWSADAPEMHFTGTLWGVRLEYRLLQGPTVQAGAFDTCLLTQHRWFFRFADVEKRRSVVAKSNSPACTPSALGLCECGRYDPSKWT